MLARLHIAARDAASVIAIVNANMVHARDGVQQPAPAPRFSRTVPEMGRPPRSPGADTRTVMAAAGFTETEIASLEKEGVVGAV